MHVEVAETGPCSRTLTIKIPPAQIQEHLDQAYAQASQHVDIKGFRKGKVPRKVLEKRYGDAIRAEAKEQLVSRSFESACREKELAFVGRPKVDGIGDEPLEPGAEFEFQVHMDVRPTFELGELKGIEVKGPDLEVKDEDVDRALADIAERKKSLNAVDEPIGEGDFVKVDLVFKNQAGDEIHRRAGAQINTNIPVTGVAREAFAEGLKGKSKGEEVSLELTYPDSFEKEEVRGQTGTVTVVLHEVLRVTPAPIDDDLAKGFEFEDLEALKTNLRERIAGERERMEKMRMEDDILQKLMDDHPYDLPASLVEEQKQHSLQGFAQRLSQSGMSEEEVKAKLEESDGEAMQDAERKVRAFFMLDAIARREGIQVTENDVTVELRNIAAANEAPLEQVQAYFAQDGRLADLRVGVMERKVREFLRENATITDK